MVNHTGGCSEKNPAVLHPQKCLPTTLAYFCGQCLYEDTSHQMTEPGSIPLSCIGSSVPVLLGRESALTSDCVAPRSVRRVVICGMKSEEALCRSKASICILRFLRTLLTWDLARVGGRFTGHKHSTKTPETWPAWVEGLLDTNTVQHLRLGQSGWKVYWTQTQYKNTWDLASLGGRFTGHKHSATTPETWPEWVEGLLDTNSTKTPETWPVWVEGSLATNSAKTPETWLAWVEGLLATNSAKTPETWLAWVEGSLVTNTVQKHLSFGLVSGKFTGHRISKHLRLSQCGWKVQWT